jgi:SAM-dependent methyltransferase
MFDYPIFGNERDVEIPLLFHFLSVYNEKLGSVLDVGCAFAKYHAKLRQYCGVLHGIDLLEDKEVEKNLDRYFKDDFLYADLPQYDFVISLSVIEHVGVEYTPTDLYREFQEIFFEKLIRTARRGVFLTFPYGEDILFSGKYHQHGRKQLNRYLPFCYRYKTEMRFFNNPNPKNPDGWREVSIKEADKSTGDLSRGVDTICELEILK